LQQQATERVEGLALHLALFSDTNLHRVQAGPFATRDEAQRVASRIREQMLLKPVVIERR
jgi:rare lipoprotein A